MGDLSRAVDGLLLLVGILLVVAVPLALWKLVDIAIWLFAHVRLGWE